MAEPYPHPHGWFPLATPLYSPLQLQPRNMKWQLVVWIFSSPNVLFFSRKLNLLGQNQYIFVWILYIVNPPASRASKLGISAQVLWHLSPHTEYNPRSLQRKRVLFATNCVIPLYTWFSAVSIPSVSVFLRGWNEVHTKSYVSHLFTDDDGFRYSISSGPFNLPCFCIACTIGELNLCDFCVLLIAPSLDEDSNCLYTRSGKGILRHFLSSTFSLSS